MHTSLKRNLLVLKPVFVNTNKLEYLQIEKMKMFALKNVPYANV